eukprot:766714-Hanusia_phi.AAC.5
MNVQHIVEEISGKDGPQGPSAAASCTAMTSVDNSRSKMRILIVEVRPPSPCLFRLSTSSSSSSAVPSTPALLQLPSVSSSLSSSPPPSCHLTASCRTKW